ncbi:2Fe-2S iron-sulfur cluster-binding protein [Oscillibacter sp.]|uniref:(2Fe-2S)-binding protein n=1 Tax=Oscillibacter sp. TaxID=1945593 RepID=UPI00289C7769|nr:2Fe-2S iron-sulfur cluster-binding protein [Oscillibacter sp.]
MTLHFFVNEKAVTLETSPQRRLLDILRDDLGLTGVKEGCAEGECGACTVLLDNRAVHACLTLAAQLEGCRVTTIEGLAELGELDILQTCFVEEIAIQCGFCTTGMIMSAKALLITNPHPTDAEIRLALSGNICRCSGYVQIVKAVKRAAEELEAKRRCDV